ncbi:hypothetical protein [Desulfocurvibacter africanus]|uniref:hypothetical protein n=1 Tax=Desulfocurvibacter africanus TaxID=873 RepID=UPI0012B5ACA6|nr:hypothetical protein [Desulfocurvibacter africanus]
MQVKERFSVMKNVMLTTSQAKEIDSVLKKYNLPFSEFVRDYVAKTIKEHQ